MDYDCLLTYGFVESRVDMYYDEWDYLDMDVDWFDPESAAEEVFGDMDIWYVTCDEDTDLDTW